MIAKKQGCVLPFCLHPRPTFSVDHVKNCYLTKHHLGVDYWSCERDECWKSIVRRDEKILHWKKKLWYTLLLVVNKLRKQKFTEYWQIKQYLSPSFQQDICRTDRSTQWKTSGAKETNFWGNLPRVRIFPICYIIAMRTRISTHPHVHTKQKNIFSFPTVFFIILLGNFAISCYKLYQVQRKKQAASPEHIK